VICNVRNLPFIARFGATTLVFALAAGSFATAAPAMHPSTLGNRAHLKGRSNLPTPIQHVIVIVQENRSVDDLFHGYPDGSSFPGLADTVQKDPVTGNVLQLCHLDQTLGCPGKGQNANCGLSHNHIDEIVSGQYIGGFAGEYDFGKMDGFQMQQGGGTCTNVGGVNPAFSYVPEGDISQYWGFAATYGLVDHALQSNSGPSFPGHQYLIAGQAAGLETNGDINPSLPWSIDENNVSSGNTSCINSPLPFATSISLSSPFPGVENEDEITPCNNYKTIFDELPSAGNTPTWRYYTNQEAGLWGGPSAVRQDCRGVNFSTSACNNPQIINCSPQALIDFIDNASVPLADVTYVIPKSTWSDHPTKASAGPNWVTWLVNTIGESPYWNNTTIIVTWDDWGGWYDHYQPPSGVAPNQAIINCATNGSLRTPASCGFRVPMVVIGPYVKSGYVDTSITNAAGSILLYIEHTFNLPTLTPARTTGELGTADTWTKDDLMNMMNFSQANGFVPQPTTTPSSYFTGSGCSDPGSPGVD